MQIAVVDDNVLFRDFLGREDTLAPHHSVVLRATDAFELAALLPSVPLGRCDVVLLDLRVSPRDLPDLTEPVHMAQSHAQGVAAVELLVECGREGVSAGLLEREPAILVYTQEPAPRVHVACLLAGASGIVHKREELDRLREAIDVVAAGGIVVTDQMADLISLLADQRGLHLTDAEAEVLMLAAHGLNRHEIARRLGSSENTVDKQLGSVRDKFGRSRPLTDIADALGLRDLDSPARGTAARRRRGLRDLVERLKRSQ